MNISPEGLCLDCQEADGNVLCEVPYCSCQCHNRWVSKNNVDKWMPYEDDIVKQYWPGLQAWLEKGCDSPGTAFTAGLQRNIAWLMWQAKQQGKEAKK